jgi:cytoskeletal protein CcmA (bactofilin family)
MARPPVSRAVASPAFSILGSDTAIKGDIASASDLHIDGRVEGDIRCAALVQGETSEIAGSIVAQSAKLAGLVEGTIDAGELVVLKTARILGDVAYDTLSIEPGAKIDGRLTARVPGAISAANDADRRGFEPYAAEEPAAPPLMLDGTAS